MLYRVPAAATRCTERCHLGYSLTASSSKWKLSPALQCTATGSVKWKLGKVGLSRGVKNGDVLVILYMGCFQSYTVFTEPEMLTYQELTGLNRAEIIQAYKKFWNIDPLSFDEYENKKGAISFLSVADTLPELSENPFRYRICKVFCSSDDGFMDFDDFLDLVSVMSDHAPIASKLSWAFKIYDFNEDEFIDCEDLNMIMDNLTGGTMAQETKNLLIDHVLKEADVDGDGALNFQEFERILTLKSSAEFMENFRFVL